MNYAVDADQSQWPDIMSSETGVLPYDKYADCFGRLNIDFCYNDTKRSYENHFTNIPLFFSELKDFLERVNSYKQQQWYIGFAPFAHGLLRNDGLVISARSGASFSDHIYDYTSQEKLEHLRTKVSKDIRRYGEVQMSDIQVEF